MATRSVKVVLEAEVAKFVTGMERSEKATEEARKAQEKLGKAADEAAKKTGQDADKTAADLEALAKAHQDAAKAAGLHYDGMGRLVDGNQRVLNSSQAATHELDAFSAAVYKTGFEAEQAAEAQSRAASETAAAAAEAAAAQESAAAAAKESAQEVSTAMLTFGVASVAGLGAAAKAAMDWESAWAGVTKTVDGTPEQMAELESGIRGLAKSLPLAHTEIAAVAEGAGQLGVAREDVVGFTKTMIDLGETTNLTADDAATNIAQISNVMGTMARDGSEGVSRFGAALVALGNDGASTEAEILSMAQRIAGAGATVGASETDVLALSNTLASMGVNAELGGGVTTRVLLKIYSAVQEGGEGLQRFADVAGLSADQFAKAFGESPVKAMDLVNKGLARVKDEGGNVVATMKDLGIKGTEETQVMLSLAASGDLLSKSLDLGSKAWQENTALTDEAAKRYETTESKVTVAWNNIKDAAIDAGAVLLPIIQTVAETVSGLAQAFGDLPKPMQGTITAIAGVAGGAALLVGGLMSVIPKIRDTAESFRTLDTRADGSSRGLGKAAKAAGIATVALIGLQVAGQMANAAAGEGRSFEEMANQIRKASTAGDEFGATFDADFLKQVGDVGSLTDLFKSSDQDDFAGFLNNTMKAVSGYESEVHRATNTLGQADKVIATMAKSGNTEAAAGNFRQFAKSSEEAGLSQEKLFARFPEYRDALLAQASAAGVTLDQQELYDFALGKIPPKLSSVQSATKDAAKAQDIMDQSLQDTGVSLDGVIADMDKFLEQLFASGMIAMSARDANAAYNDALRGIPEAMEEIAKSEGKMGRILNDTATDFDLTTEAGSRANDAFQTVARKGMAEVEAMAKEGVGQEELQTKLGKTHTDLVQAGIDLGLTADGAEALARKVLGVPDGVEVKTWIDQTAAAQADALKTKLDGLDGRQIRVGMTLTQFIEQKGEYVTQADLNGDTFREGRASGGAIYGPGTGTSDEAGVFALSNGEHVLTASEVAAMGGQQAVYRFRSDLRGGGVPGYAGGGAVGTVTSSRQLATFNAPAPAPSGGGGMHIDKVEINEQSDPVATFMEFSRRSSALAT